MTKSEVIKFFDNKVGEVAKAVGTSGSAVSQWPEDINQATQDRVIGAIIRLGKKVPEEWLNKSNDAA